MHRAERHAAIQRLIREHPISTQGDLAEALRRQGHEVVQTTVSRDIHELGLVKVRDGAGRLVYAFPEDAPGIDEDLADALARWALTVEPSGNLVVVTTPYGYAQALAQAIDVAHHPHVAGTLAGENTILLVAREPLTGARLADELRTRRQAA
ncbi:MAG TPA: arginine repressor [Gaiellaceae bacterium]|jgi:transcriptional regulator of arginine metabolism|nr:arginine repressor [Gaiellaceae bacterium]